MSETRSFKISARPDGATIEVGGREMRGVRGYEIRHDAGYLPHLNLDYEVVDLSEISGEAHVTVTAKGIDFTRSMVDALERALEDYERNAGEMDRDQRLEYGIMRQAVQNIDDLLPPRDQP